MLARTHKTLIWERTRAVQRLRHQLREYFPAALEAFEDLDAADTLELLGKAPDPARAARLTRAQVAAALKRARRRDIPDKADGDPGRAAQRAAGPARSPDSRLRRHRPGADRGDHHPERAGQVPARAGGGSILAGTRTLRSTGPSPAWAPSSAPGCSAEFGDDPHRYADGKARRNYAGTSPITRASGKKKVVAARFIHNDRLIDALNA